VCSLWVTINSGYCTAEHLHLDHTKQPFLGYSVYAGSIDALLGEVLDNAGRRGAWLACLNPHSYVVAKSEASFHRALQSCNWLIPDGAGITIASRLLPGSRLTRITGPDFFLALSNFLKDRGPCKVMFLGSTESTLLRIRSRYEREFPALGPVTTYSPPFRQEFTDSDLAAISAAINEIRPDILWVGLTAPKQEKLLNQLAENCNFGFAAAIGAAFDFYAGTVQRPSLALRRAGLEWLPRLLREPRRLWHRTLVSTPIFLGDVLKEAMTKGKSGASE
jgi:N-acetylglucosaminyldiphosphoundecaprenol N-acetyl-beta-D-mannosaminyltransferase